MNQTKYYVGIDISSETFTSAVGTVREKWEIVKKPETFSNEISGLQKYLYWLQEEGAMANNSVVCMEATGVYGELLAHFLVANKYTVSIEPPLKVKRAFHPEGHKSDPVDSKQISEYAYRFWDELSIWKPRKELIEQINTLLTVREQFVSEKTGHKNALQALKRKVIRTPVAESIHESAITNMNLNIKQINEEIKKLINQDPDFRAMVQLLITIPGVGITLASYILVILQSGPESATARQLAAYIGICPYACSSGTSIHKAATSRHYGPSGVRRLLFLAALSVRTHNPKYREYFYRKQKEGKASKLIINNIANNLLKVIIAVLRSNTPYIENYQSINPGILSLSLTRS